MQNSQTPFYKEEMSSIQFSRIHLKIIQKMQRQGSEMEGIDNQNQISVQLMETWKPIYICKILLKRVWKWTAIYYIGLFAENYLYWYNLK